MTRFLTQAGENCPDLRHLSGVPQSFSSLCHMTLVTHDSNEDTVSWSKYSERIQKVYFSQVISMSNITYQEAGTSIHSRYLMNGINCAESSIIFMLRLQLLSFGLES